MKVQGRTKYHFRKQFRVFSWSYSNRDLFLTLWLWIFIVSHQHKGLSSQQEQNRGSPSIWDPMSFRESVVNMVSEAEKFKYKPTVLTVGRKKNTVAWLYLRIQLVEDQNQYHYLQCLLLQRYFRNPFNPHVAHRDKNKSGSDPALFSRGLFLDMCLIPDSKSPSSPFKATRGRKKKVDGGREGKARQGLGLGEESSVKPNNVHGWGCSKWSSRSGTCTRSSPNGCHGELLRAREPLTSSLAVAVAWRH